ncbi:hypothetical protein CRUP_004324, partial [Coryphaenoides rupestris]
ILDFGLARTAATGLLMTPYVMAIESMLGTDAILLGSVAAFVINQSISLLMSGPVLGQAPVAATTTTTTAAAVVVVVVVVVV